MEDGKKPAPVEDGLPEKMEMSRERLKQIQEQSYQALLKALQDGKISPQEAKRQARALGYRVHVRVGGRKCNSKYTAEQLREMRRKNGVGRKKNASQSE